jgi:UDP-2-acetamido-2-deoxy-ribo-hexuluronate aminotransferase
MKTFDLIKQYKIFEKDINKRVLKVLSSGSYILGQNVKSFENNARNYLATRYTVSCNSGTDALVMSLRALNIGNNDQVITTPFTYFATSEAISLVGATPIFADINPHTYNINPKKIEKLISKKTKAILSVNLFGQACELDKVSRIAKKYNLSHIEDCAQSFGATYKMKQTGSYGDIGCFSFFPTKNLGCFGDGGLITAKNKKVYESLLKLRTHGGIKRNQHDMIGYNSRLDEIQAAILDIKLKHINKLIKKRIDVAESYYKLITNEKIRLPYKDINGKHTFNQFTIRVANRKKLENHLKKYRIPYGIYYPKPIYKYKAYANYRYNDLPMVEKVSNQCLSLPIYPELGLKDIKIISNVLNEYE